MTDTIEVRVGRGVALLDEKLPGWVDRIDLDRLNLASSCNCILGQEFADAPEVREWDDMTGFDVGASAVLDDPSKAARYGFDRYGRDESYEPLTAEWRRIILARRAVTA